MTNDREHINRKTQFGRNPTSSGSSISVEQTADSAVAAFSHSELHKSSEARIAPLTLTQEMSEEGDGGGGRQAQDGKKEKGGRKEIAFLLPPFDLLLLLSTGVGEETKLPCVC